jgi:hypothetical protein
MFRENALPDWRCTEPTSVGNLTEGVLILRAGATYKGTGTWSRHPFKSMRSNGGLGVRREAAVIAVQVVGEERIGTAARRQPIRRWLPSGLVGGSDGKP